MASSHFGNWQRFLDEQTKNITWVRQIVQKRNSADVFKQILLCDKMRECQWISDYFQAVQTIKKTGFKNERVANTFRCKGNLAFKKKNYKAALEEYNNAILKATHPEELSEDSVSELSLSYGNRSAVYLHLDMLEACLSDISAALACGYPEVLRSKLYTRQAQCHVRGGRGDLAEAAIKQAESYVQKAEKNRQEAVLEEIKKVKVKVKLGQLPVNSVQSSPIIDPPVPVHGFHPVVTQASAALDLRYTHDQGRHLVSRRDIAAGQTLIVERPYASVLLPDYYTSHCHHCHDKLSNFYPCRACVRVRFCSPVCEAEAWCTYHSVECPYQDLLHSVGIAHLSLRVILTAGLTRLREFRNTPSPSSDNIPGVTAEGRYERNYQSVHALMPHTEHLQPEDLTQYALTARLLLKVLEHSDFFETNQQNSSDILPGERTDLSQSLEGLHLREAEGYEGVSESLEGLHFREAEGYEGVREWVGSLLLRHICQLVCNAHAITEIQISQLSVSDLVDTQSQERIATAIYPTTSLLNHSCQPTIINSFIKNQLVVRTVREVKAGEQIYNCYGPHSSRMEYRQRQAGLRAQYFFTCQCKACVDQGQLEALYTALSCPQCQGPVPISGDYQGQCLDCGGRVDTEKALIQVHRDEKAFVKALKLMDGGKLKDCQTMLLKTLESQSHLLHRHNRDLSQTQDALARCHATRGEYTKAIPYLQQAMVTTEMIYGKNSIECGYELQKYAELLLRAGQKEACYQATEKAIAIFKVYYGQEHAILEELSKLMLVAKYS